MRLNMPVTDREYVLSETDAVASKTDLKGIITYANADFVRISGYSEAELVGSPHNIVRHPDMPPEAFADLWRTLQAGKAWTGLVKNRTKDGDFYWVEANAAPILENGRAVGYTSVRTRPSREQVRAAEEAYRRLREGDRSIGISEGAAIARSRWRVPNLLSRLSLRTRLRAATAFASTLFVGIGILGWIALSGFGTAAGTTLVLLAAAGVVGAVVGGLYFERAVLVPLTNATTEVLRMAQGDLTRRLRSPGTDETAALGQALRVLQTNLKMLVGQIKEITDIVKAGADEISTGGLELSSRTEEQAASLAQTASAMEELTSTVNQNADNSVRANELVDEASRVAAQGGEVVGDVVGTMREITTSSKKIADIIAVIDGIAFQTNILALNAAVEAARAGEHGRGFAVVAGEVRSLSQRSAEAAREIKSLIVDSVQRIEQGSTLVERAGSTMGEIVEAVREAATIMSEISSASREQAGGIAQVGQAVTQMDQATQQNAALVEESAGAAATLTAQAARLQQAVGAFRLT